MHKVKNQEDFSGVFDSYSSCLVFLSVTLSSAVSAKISLSQEGSACNGASNKE